VNWPCIIQAAILTAKVVGLLILFVGVIWTEIYLIMTRPVAAWIFGIALLFGGVFAIAYLQCTGAIH
jgi:hypothetical protein